MAERCRARVRLPSPCPASAASQARRSAWHEPGQVGQRRLAAQMAGPGSREKAADRAVSLDRQRRGAALVRQPGQERRHRQRNRTCIRQRSPRRAPTAPRPQKRPAASRAGSAGRRRSRLTSASRPGRRRHAHQHVPLGQQRRLGMQQRAHRTAGRGTPPPVAAAARRPRRAAGCASAADALAAQGGRIDAEQAGPGLGHAFRTRPACISDSTASCTRSARPRLARPAASTSARASSWARACARSCRAWRPCGRRVRRHARAPAGSARGTAPGARPGSPGWRADRRRPVGLGMPGSRLLRRHRTSRLHSARAAEHPHHATEGDARAEAASRVPVLLPYPFAGPFDYARARRRGPGPGDIVLVPLNRREEVGVVWDAPAGPSVRGPQAEAGDALLDAPADAGGAAPLHRLGGRLHPVRARRGAGHGAAGQRAAPPRSPPAGWQLRPIRARRPADRRAPPRAGGAGGRRAAAAPIWRARRASAPAWCAAWPMPGCWCRRRCRRAALRRARPGHARPALSPAQAVAARTCARPWRRGRSR